MLLSLAWTGGCGPIWWFDAGFAQRLAKQENKPLLIYFKAWDSTQHRNMKLKVFEHPPTKEQLMETVNLELEFAWFPDYARRYRVQRPQVCVMCAPDGKKVSTSMYVNPVPTEKAFLDWLLKAKALAVPPPTTAPGKMPTTRPASTGAKATTVETKPPGQEAIKPAKQARPPS